MRLLVAINSAIVTALIACGGISSTEVPPVPAARAQVDTPTGGSSEAANPAVAPLTPTATHRVFSEEYINLSETSLTDLPHGEARRLRAQIVAAVNELPEAYSQKIRSVSMGLVSDANITMRWAELREDGELLLNVFGESPAERERRLELALEELTAQAEVRSTAWARERLEALVGLYGFTEDGVKWMRNFHLRQMVGEPFWGGSYNKTDRSYSQTWAGVGSWVTIQTKMHEVQHTSWGAFPVTGRPDLSWTLSPKGQPVGTIGETAALSQYHADVEEFIKSAPPVGYEMFHTLLTQISRHDVMHTADADVIVLTGGNLNLIPPSLKPYYGQLLKAGEFQNWDETLRWYIGLSDEDRDIADAYLLFSLLVETLSEAERSALTPEVHSRLPKEVREIVFREERQELLDFADQYPLYIAKPSFVGVGKPSSDIGQIIGKSFVLHLKHPGVLRQHPMGSQVIADALEHLHSQGVKYRDASTGYIFEYLIRGGEDSAVVLLREAERLSLSADTLDWLRELVQQIYPNLSEVTR